VRGERLPLMDGCSVLSIGRLFFLHDGDGGPLHRGTLDRAAPTCVRGVTSVSPALQRRCSARAGIMARGRGGLELEHGRTSAISPSLVPQLQ
jgi:hypothetical protein